MFYLFNIIKMRWVAILSIFGLYSHTQKYEDNDVYATKKRHIAPVSAADTLNLQQVGDGVHMGVSKLGLLDLIFVDTGVKISGPYYCDMLLTQKQCVRSVPYSLSSNNATLLLLFTEREKQSTFWNDRLRLSFYHIFGTQQHRSEPA